MIDTDSFYGRIIVYDDKEAAEFMAQILNVPVKHAKVKKNAHFTTFSVVVTDSEGDHRSP